MRVAVGVTGGVAAYKAAELVRVLQQEGLEVEVVMTRAACEFVTPLTFAALTGRKVITAMFGAENAAPANVESAIEHIAVAQRIDALVIAPATADFLARMANGLAEALNAPRPDAPVYFHIYRLDPADGKILWDFYREEAPVDDLVSGGGRYGTIFDRAGVKEGGGAGGCPGARRRGDERQQRGAGEKVLFHPLYQCPSLSVWRPGKDLAGIR